MSEKQARTLTHLSNRARDRLKLERKAVYKSTLENPFQIKWPIVPLNVQNALLARLVATMGNQRYFRIRDDENRRQRKMRQIELEHQAQSNVAGNDAQNSTKEDATRSSVSLTPPSASNRPELSSPVIIQHLVFGINQVTKRLESQIKHVRHIVTVTKEGAATSSASHNDLSVVFVCRSDVDPPLLVSHIPHLVAAYNSALPSQHSDRVSEPVLLVPLPKGAETILAEATGLKRVAVLSMNSTAKQLADISNLLNSVPVVRAAWLAQTARPRPSFVPTHLKQTRTTAPKDMKASKELRVAGRREAKKRKLKDMNK